MNLRSSNLNNFLRLMHLLYGTSMASKALNIMHKTHLLLTSSQDPQSKVSCSSFSVGY